jgi:ABC-type phosphate/phosphonate transport system substrate-binding protein
MISSKRIAATAFAVAATLSFSATARAADLRIAILQAQAGEARKYQPLLDYVSRKGVAATFVTVPNYLAATSMFAKGEVDAMFGGSGVSCAMMMAGTVEPFARSIGPNGPRTYSAVVVAAKGGPKFDGTAAWFAGKRVIFAPLASAGEFYFRSFGPSRAAALLKAASHGAALDTLSRGLADVAIVKNHVWTKEKPKYPGLEEVGADTAQNPDGGLIVSKRIDRESARRLLAILLGLAADGGPEAAEAKRALEISGFVAATAKDYEQTFAMVKRAGVGKDFKYEF